MSGMRRSYTAVAVASALALLVGAAFGIGALRWRTRLVWLKASGELPEVQWTELASIVTRHAPDYLPALFSTHSAYQSIIVPDSSDAAITRGKAGFERQCSSCHGSEARGASAPALVGRTLRHGDGDWALFVAISRGFAGTAMPAFRLPAQDRWSLVAYLRSLRLTTSDPSPTPGLAGFTE